jgi:hypothetical protein
VGKYQDCTSVKLAGWLSEGVACKPRIARKKDEHLWTETSLASGAGEQGNAAVTEVHSTVVW